MKFDYTKGMKAKYMVHLYAWSVDDRYYFHYFKDALKLFEEMKDTFRDYKISISVYDIEQDIRKAFVKCG